MMLHPLSRQASTAAAIRAACVALALASSAALPTLVPAVHAQTGFLVGRVLVGKEPAEGANVILLGTRLGAETDAAGAFRIGPVAVGAHTLRAQMMGYDARTVAVTVNAGENRLLPIVFGEANVVRVVPDVVVRAPRMIDPTKTSIDHRMTAEQFKDKPVDNLMQAIALMSGVVATAGVLHVHGGRDDELGVRYDDLPVVDPLTRQAPALASLSVADVDFQSSGIDAEHGDALSGFVNVTTREGADTLAGDVQWHTDRYGESGKTFDRYDRFTFGFGGPTPVRRLTYYATYEGSFSDTYLHSGLSEPSRSFFDFLRLGNRQSNQVNTNLKLAWRIDPENRKKLTVEAIANRSLATPYDHMWSRKGFVSVTRDADGNDVYGRWSFFPEDSTFQPENLADHVPTTDTRFQQLKAVWRQSIGKRDVYTVRLSQVGYRSVTAVQGKAPWEYAVQSPQYWSGNLENSPYYATHGDFPLYARRRSTSWTGKADYTTARWKGHEAKAGIEGTYNAVSLLAMQNPNQEANGLPGLNRSDFTNYNPEGSAYVQDRWLYEGLVLNAGMRFDLFTPGAQVPSADLPHGRYKQQVSPRLGVAYPVSDRDVLSFHYGWTFQTPARNFVFENRGSQSNVTVRGNPDLEPETDISYQAAVQHLFSRDVAGQFALFFRDIFGLISVRQAVDAQTGLLVPQYVNQDYASARGFEATLSKRFSHRCSAEIDYTYSIATGVASDPNAGLQFAQGRALYLPIAEQALNWDQRNTLNANVIVREPGKWGLTLLWSYGSGLPFTPSFRNDRKPDPRYRNTRRLPSQSTLSITGDKFARVWGQDVTFFLDARNVLDATPIATLAPNNVGGENPYIDTIGSDYLVYYTETGRAGGAYLRDNNGDHVEDWNPVNDPRVFAEGRDVRVGVGVAF